MQIFWHVRLTPALPKSWSRLIRHSCLHRWSTLARSQLEEGYEEIYEMYQNGQLFTSDDYEQFADMMVSAPIKAMCLNVAHDCNLRCSYCFASTGDLAASAS